MEAFFVDVIMPVAVPKAFTYRLPRDMEDYVKPGARVAVPFGKNKLFTGIVEQVHNTPPAGYTAKYVDDLLDAEPVVNHKQLEFWNWLADYYMCTRGEVLTAALPGAMRLTSQSRYVPNPAFDGDLTDITPKGETVLNALAVREVLSGEEIADLLGVKGIHATVKKLLDAGAILVMEELKEQYKPKVVQYLRLAEDYADEQGLQTAFSMLANAPKQEQALMMFVQLSRRYEEDRDEVRKSVLQKMAEVSTATVKTLIDKGVFELYEREVDRMPAYTGETLPHPSFSPAQAKALTEVDAAFDKHDVALLHGVTSSGKTELYIELMRRALEQGRQGLYILPEIALTTQIILRLRSYFGDAVTVYHSRLNQQERVEVWNKVRDTDNPKARLVLGARSALFLPFHHLGLVIVDEEHESAFKQFNPAPRYNGRDAAIVLAAIHGAKTLLGSATPSFESMHNAQTGKYGYVALNERFGGMNLPEIKAVPLPTQREGCFSDALLEAISRTLANKEQVILFQNRRGYAPTLVCLSCGWSPECVRCDVTATYHKQLDRYVCHYCGNRYAPPPACPACGNGDFKLAGFGTERIEEELPIHFPDARVARLDLDSTRSKTAYSQILGDFQDGHTDVLIGTQMVTKGLDFDRVSLVGILNADLLLKYPDFRATERGFQLMTQVAGRAGRRDKRGQVLIQTRDAGNWLIKKVIEGDYAEVLDRELAERRKFVYPPFARLIKLTFRHKEGELVDFCAAAYHEKLTEIIPKTHVLGPEYPHVKRVRNRYNKDIFVKIGPDMSLKSLKNKIAALNLTFFANKQFRSVRLSIDVDPR